MIRSIISATTLALAMAGPAMAQQGPADAELMADAQSTGGDAELWHGSSRGHRFSPLTKLDSGNVAKLTPVFSASLGGEESSAARKRSRSSI